MTRKTSLYFLGFLFSLAFFIQCSQEKTEAVKSEISWIENMDQALVSAEDLGKPLMIDFTATWCPPCKKMEDSTFSNLDVIKKSLNFVTVRIDVDKQGDVANKYQSNAGKYGGIGIPNILFLNSDGEEILHPIGFKGPEEFLAIMDSALTLANQ